MHAIKKGQEMFDLEKPNIFVCVSDDENIYQRNGTM